MQNFLGNGYYFRTRSLTKSLRKLDTIASFWFGFFFVTFWLIPDHFLEVFQNFTSDLSYVKALLDPCVVAKRIYRPDLEGSLIN